MDRLLRWYGTGYFFSNTTPSSIHDLRLSHGSFDEDRPAFRKERVREVPSDEVLYDPYLSAPIKGGEEVVQYDMGDDFCNFSHIPITHRIHQSKYQKRELYQGTVQWTQANLVALLRKHQLNDQENTTSDDGIRVTASKTSFSTQVALLQGLKSALQKEHEALSFDYLAMHVSCLNMQRKMQKALSGPGSKVSITNDEPSGLRLTS